MSIDLALSGILDELHSTLLDRHRKYGSSNIADSPGGPLNGLRVRLYDKLARINHAVDQGDLVDFDDDSFRDAFVDVVGYGLIGLLVLDGQWPGSDAPAGEPLDWQALVDRSPAHVALRTHRWSELAPGDPDRKTDAWPVGTMYVADDGGWTWLRRVDDWVARDGAGRWMDNARTLHGIVHEYQYSDGTITTPNIDSTEKEEAA